MKKLFLNTLAITALFALMSNACDDLKDELKIDLDFDEAITIDVASAQTYSDNYVTEPNEKISQYLGEIESLKLEEISYRVSPTAQYVEGTSMALTFSYSAFDDSTPIEFLTTDNLFASLDTDIKIDLTQAQLDALADLLKEDGKLKIYADGTCDGPAHAEVKLNFKGSFNPLN